MTTVTREQLCALALQAIDDADTRIVLADALELEGWWDRRLGDYVWHGERWDIRWNMPVGFWRSNRLEPRYLTAIAAVLLFGGWPKRWELAERCEVIEFTDVQLIGHDGNVVRFVHYDDETSRDRWIREGEEERARFAGVDRSGPTPWPADFIIRPPWET